MVGKCSRKEKEDFRSYSLMKYIAGQCLMQRLHTFNLSAIIDSRSMKAPLARVITDPEKRATNRVERQSFCGSVH